MGRPTCPRTAQACSKFSAVDPTAPGTFTCLIPGCGVAVRCREGCGATGRIEHLRRYHVAVYDALPAATHRTTLAQRASAAAAVAVGGGDGVDLTPLAQRTLQTPQTVSQPVFPSPAVAVVVEDNPPRKRARADTVAAAAAAAAAPTGATPTFQQLRSMSLNFLARHALPNTCADDRLFESLGLSSRTIGDDYRRAVAERRGHFATNFSHLPASIAIDSGTNEGEQTLNICIGVCGMSRLLAAPRPADFEAPTLSLCVEKALERSARSFTVRAFISDGAQNMRNACETLAESHRALVGHCGCHAIDRIVRGVCLTWEVVDRARTVAAKARQLVGTRIPVEIDTRWGATFLAIEKLQHLSQELLYQHKLTDAEAHAAPPAIAVLKPLFLATRQLEKDDSTIFDVVEAFGTTFAGDIENDSAFPEKFERNCFGKALVAACAFVPSLLPASLAEPLQQLMRLCLLSCARRVHRGDLEHALATELRMWQRGDLQAVFSDPSAPRRALEDCWPRSPAAPLLGALFGFVASVPASSASVERSFSLHARVHTPQRHSLSAATVEAQVALGTFLNNATTPTLQPLTVPSTTAAYNVVRWSLLALMRRRAPKLTPGAEIVVYFLLPSRRLQHYSGKLLAQLPGERVWSVRWSGRGDQEFRALVDPWFYQSEWVTL